MILPAERHAIDQGQGVAPAAARRPRYAWDGPWIAIIPAVVTLAVALYQISRPTLWQDEIATLADINRPLPQVFRLLGHVDAVHGAYYLIMWVVAKVLGTSAVALRLPSAVAMGVAAGGVTLLGRRLMSARAGLAAGLVFAALPQVSWYGQDAREIALVTAFATVASYLFVRALDAAPGERRRWLIAYGIVLAVLGLLNLFALLLIPAHGLTIAALMMRQRRAGVVARTGPGTAAGAATRLPFLGWLTAAMIATLVASPVMVFGWQERQQIAWLPRPDAHTIARLEKLIGPSWMVVAILGITAIAIIGTALRGKERLREEWPTRLTALAVPWLVLPAALLVSVSFVFPVFVQRYVIFSLPALALLVGAGLASLGWAAGAIGLAVLVVLGLPAQAQARAADGHGQNLRRVSTVLAEHAHPGDAVLFGNSYVRKVEVGYPDGFRSLRDISFGKPAVQAAQPAATNAPPGVVRQRLHTVTRLWVVTLAQHRYSLPPLHELGFTRAGHWAVRGYDISFYVR